MRAFFFKLRHDLTFRITLFVGLGLSVFLTVLYYVLDHAIDSSGSGISGLFCTGQSMLVSSLNPAQNFGIAIPVNLISFTVLEFTQGIIRNKIIAGNSKAKIYFGLLLSGLVFTFILMIGYAGLSVGLASILGGFNANGMMSTGGYSTPEFLWKYVLLAALAFTMITIIAVFFATLLRSIGPCIPIVILLVLTCYLTSTIVGSMANVPGMPNMDGAMQVLKIINPLHSLSVQSTKTVDEHTAILYFENDAFFSEIINNVVYSVLFGGLGLIIFKKRDIK